MVKELFNFAVKEQKLAERRRYVHEDDRHWQAPAKKGRTSTVPSFSFPPKTDDPFRSDQT